MEYRYNTHTLSNGLRIIHRPMENEVVYCGYAVHAGARDEEKGEEGLAHFCEHMTFKGTERLTSLQIINRLEAVGGDLNAFTTKEVTFYYATVLRQYFNRAVDLLSDIVFGSTYPQHEIDKEVEVVCDEIESYRDSPAELIYDEIENSIFEGHPLGHNVLGESENVRKFTTEQCRKFTDRNYRPENIVFYVLGKIDFAKLVQRLERMEVLSRFGPAEPIIIDCRPKTTVCHSHKGEEIVREIGSHQAHVMQAATITADMDKWKVPLFLANSMLGGTSMNSRLNLSLRERRGLVYTVESIISTYNDVLLWSVYYGCDVKDVKRCQRLVDSELSRIINRELSAAVLKRAKQQLKGQLMMNTENNENFALDMARKFLHYGTLKDPAKLCQEIDNVTPQEIHEMAELFFQKNNFTTMIMR